MDYSFAKLFGTSTLFSEAQTGITNMELILYTKASEKVKSDLQSKETICQIYTAYEVDTLTCTNLGGYNSLYLSRGHESTSDVILAL